VARKTRALIGRLKVPTYEQWRHAVDLCEAGYTGRSVEQVRDERVKEEEARRAEALEQIEALRVHKYRKHAICHLRGIADTRWCDSRRIYLHPWIAVHDALQRLSKSGRARTGVGDLVVLACVGQRFIAIEYLADDFNVLAGAQKGLAVSDTVPTLHHLWAGWPDTEDEATG
jgi:hypothetical protein